MKRGLEYLLAGLDAVERSAGTPSPLHRIDTRAKTVVTVLYLATMLSLPLTHLSELLLYALFPILGATAAGMRYTTLFRRSLFVLPFIAFIGLFNLLYDRVPVFAVGAVTVTRGWICFAAILLRGLLSVQALLLLITTTGYYRLCRGLQRLGVPALFAAQLLFVYRYLYVLLEEALSISRARDARSFGRRSYPLKVWAVLVGQLLIRTCERARRIDRAMVARGFTGRIPDTAPVPTAWETPSLLFLLLTSGSLLLLRLFPPVAPLARSSLLP